MIQERTNKHAVTVRIAGEEHTIRSEAEPEHTRACAEFVDAAIAEVRRSVSLIETHKAAILAALSITDQLLRARQELERGSDEMAGRLEALARRLEEAVSGPAR